MAEGREFAGEYIEKEFPRLYGKATNGKLMVSDLYVIVSEEERDNPSCATILTERGCYGGAMQIDEKHIYEGKNLGRSNETTILEQAILEADSKFTKKAKSGYNEDKEKAGGSEFPMKAKPFKDRKHKVVYPAIGQRKLNGLRCVVKRPSLAEITFKTNLLNDFVTLDHWRPFFLRTLAIGQELDGEVYNHEMTFQEIISAAKATNENTKRLEFHCFDSISDKPFLSRYNDANEVYLDGCDLDPIRMVENVIYECEADVIKYHDQWVKEGYEGAMIRSATSPYIHYRPRTDYLLKHKAFFDKEYEIVDVIDGDGTSFEGCAIFVCKIESGATFNVTPIGTCEHREQLYEDRAVLIGKQLTVRYPALSDDGKPTHHVGITVRDYE